MISHSLTTSSLPSRLVFPNYTSFSKSPRTRTRIFSCYRESRHDGVDMATLSDRERKIEDKKSEIWQLYLETQQSLLELNECRLRMKENLIKSIDERNLLFEKLEKLELARQAWPKKDQASICWSLLLRIDSMVLNRLMSTGEASKMRRLVMDHRVIIVDAFSGIFQKTDAELLEELRQFSNKSHKNGFHIIHICTEMAPVASFGAVASYVTGLSQALQKKGNLVEVILPMYESMELKDVQGLREIEVEYYSYFNGNTHGNKIWTGVVCGIGVTFIQPLHYSSFFSREKPYGYFDDFERFMYFSRASLDYIVKSGKQPDVLHIHNWETAIIGPLFWDHFVQQGLEGTRILFTCHDLHSQCLVQPEKLALCGLDPSSLHRPDRLQDNSNTHLVNILKGGIVYSNKVVLMSSFHPKGSIIHNLSGGLKTTLNTHKEKLLIAPYGFENSSWDPAKDNLLPVRYNADDMKGKAACKIALRQKLGLIDRPSIISVGCFLSDMSDVDIEHLRAVVQNGARMGVQFIFMRTGKMTSKEWESLSEEIEDENVRFINRHDETLSHLIFGGSDIILCTSLHDPILQVPLKALRYGAAPITISSDDNRFRLFTEYDYETTKLATYINSTFGCMSLGQALDEIKNNPSEWKRKVCDAMSMDFSWDAECCDIHLSAYTAIKNL